jgi:hypothetical protein
MSLFRLPRPRLEFKYRISEKTALAVREFIGGFLESDRNAAEAENASYVVSSCYLDSADLQTFWHTVKDSEDRYKLRIRAYGREPEAPVFLEIKRRLNGMVLKSRAMVRRCRLTGILKGRLPEITDLVSEDPRELLAAEEFVQLMTQIQATPTALVVYDREAWSSPDQTTDRLTMDRRVRVWPVSSFEFEVLPEVEPSRPFGKTVILEMKFSDGKPAWFRDLEMVLGLRRSSAAKYCEGILRRGIERFVSGGPPSPAGLGEDGSVTARMHSRLEALAAREQKLHP